YSKPSSFQKYKDGAIRISHFERPSFSVTEPENGCTARSRINVAIFGISGKQPAPASSSKKGTPRPEGRGRTSALAPQPPNTLQRNADLANATARKSDAIESEMSSEFTTAHAANSTMPGPAAIMPAEPATPQQL